MPFSIQYSVFSGRWSVGSAAVFKVGGSDEVSAMLNCADTCVGSPGGGSRAVESRSAKHSTDLAVGVGGDVAGDGLQPFPRAPLEPLPEAVIQRIWLIEEVNNQLNSNAASDAVECGQ